MSDSPKSPVERREEGVPEWRIALADAVDGTVAHLSLMMLLIIDIIIIGKLPRLSRSLLCHVRHARRPFRARDI